MSVTHAANLPQLLLQAVRQRPWWSGLCVRDAADPAKSVKLSYLGLLDTALRILGGLQKHERRRGAHVALLLESATDFIPAFWACVLGGFIPCPMGCARGGPQGWTQQVAQLHALLDRPLLLTTRAAKQVLPAMTVVELDTLRGCAPARLDSAGRAKPSEPAIIALVCGSADDCSKAVVLSHASLLAAIAAKVIARGLTANDVMLNCQPFHCMEGLLDGHLLPLFAGASEIHAGPEKILAEPLLLLRLMARHRVSSTAIPASLLTHFHTALEPEREKAGKLRLVSLDLSCVRHIVLGNGPVSVKSARRVLDLLEPCKLSRHALWPSFGLAETCGAVVYSREFPDADSARELASVGLPLPGVQIRIAGQQGSDASADSLGEVQLRGPMLFQHYYNDLQTTDSAFAADGWFRTGYLGRIENARLDINDWGQDAIVISGVTYRYGKLEAALEELEGVKKGYVAAFTWRPEPEDSAGLVIAFATSVVPEDELRLYQLVRALRAAVMSRLGCRPTLVLPLPKEVFPETGPGASRRRVLRKRLESGELAVYQTQVADLLARREGRYVRPENAVEATIVKIYAEMFGLDGNTVSTTASCFDLGCTSIEVLHLRRGLEQVLGLAELPLSILLRNPTARELAACLSPEHLGKGCEYDSLVPLQLSGRGTPLFCVHPDDGEVLAFVNLAQHFAGERPVYALRARGFDEGERCFDNFGEMIRNYVGAIRKRQARGPYAVLGYSYGSLVAFEIAKALEARGERVAFLGCVGPPPHLKPSVRSDALHGVSDLACSLGLVSESQATEMSSHAGGSTLLQDSCEYAIRLARRERLIELDLDLRKFKAWAVVAQSVVMLGSSYSPSGTVHSIHVFSLRRAQYPEERGPTGKRWSWDELSRASVRYIDIDVSGEQTTLLDPEPVIRFQAALRAELDRALSRGEGTLATAASPEQDVEGAVLTDDSLFTEDVFADVFPIVSRHLRKSQGVAVQQPAYRRGLR